MKSPLSLAKTVSDLFSKLSAEEKKALVEFTQGFFKGVQRSMNEDRPPMTFTYTNYRGATSLRRAIPLSVRFGKTEWHPAPCWLLLAFDLDKNAEREFAMEDIGRVPEVGVKTPPETVVIGEPPLTAGQLADALSCFWNAAIGQSQHQQSGRDIAVLMATGIGAISTRLQEIADEQRKV